jgi:hypothetical protein
LTSPDGKAGTHHGHEPYDHSSVGKGEILMGTTASLAGTAGVTMAASALIASPAAAAPKHQDHGDAAFVQSDSVAGNTIVAYARSAGGTLTETYTDRTGGPGGVLAGSVVDHLASQGGLAFDESLIDRYTANAGSDTVTAFDVHGTRSRSPSTPAATSFSARPARASSRRSPCTRVEPSRRLRSRPIG